MRGNTYSVEHAESVIRANNTLKGRIMRYDKDRGYGFIYKRSHGEGKEIFFRKDDFVSNTNGTKARVGSKVTFTLDIHDGKVCARNVKVTGHIYDGHNRVLELPGGKSEINYKSILKFGKSNCYLRIIYDDSNSITEDMMRENGYSESDFDYVFIRTLKTEYKIFEKGSPITGDGQVDSLGDYLKFLNKELLMINDYISESSDDCEDELKEQEKSKFRKPKDINEVREFIFNKLKEEYGDNVLGENIDRNQIVVDTETSFHGNSDVWIDLDYFH